MNERIKLDTIGVPERLTQAIDLVVAEYAAAHRESPKSCRRAVEITILQRGVASLRDELKANAALGVRMGWREKEEESGT